MRKLLSTVCGLALLGLVNQAGAVSLSLQPGSQTARPSDTVSLDLVVDGLGDFAPDSLGDFDIDIGYDMSALSFLGYSLGSFLGDIGLGEAIDFSSGDLGGAINLAELSLLDPDAISGPSFLGPYLDDIQPGSFTLVTLDFSVDVLTPGSSTIVSIDTVNAMGDGFGLPLTVDATSDAVISAVPLPAGVWLFVSGLLGLIGSARRKKA